MMKKIVLIVCLCVNVSYSFAQTKKMKEDVAKTEKKCNDINFLILNEPKGGGNYSRITIEGGNSGAIMKIAAYYDSAEGDQDSTIFYFGEDCYNDKRNFGKLIKYRKVEWSDRRENPIDSYSGYSEKEVYFDNDEVKYIRTHIEKKYPSNEAKNITIDKLEKIKDSKQKDSVLYYEEVRELMKYYIKYNSRLFPVE